MYHNYFTVPFMMIGLHRNHKVSCLPVPTLLSGNDYKNQHYPCHATYFFPLPQLSIFQQILQGIQHSLIYQYFLIHYLSYRGATFSTICSIFLHYSLLFRLLAKILHIILFVEHWHIYTGIVKIHETSLV